MEVISSRFIKFIIGLSQLLGFLSPTHAKGLGGAKLLAPGESIFGMATQWTSSTKYFASDGKKRALGDPYHKVLLLQKMGSQLASLALTDHEKKLIKGRDRVNAVDLDFRIERFSFEMIPSWYHGLYERWTIGIFFPFVTSRVSIKPHFSFGRRHAGLTSAQQQVYEGIAQKLNKKRFTVTDQILSEENYSSIGASDAELYLGNVTLVNRFGLFNSGDHRLSVESLLEFPGIEGADRTQYVAGTMLDGQIDLSLGLLWDVYLHGNVGLESGISYVYQFADKVVIARAHQQNLADQGEPRRSLRSSRKLGDKIEGKILALVKVAQNWQFYGGYQYKFKDRDKYEISQKADILYFDKPSDGHFARFGVSYSNQKAWLRSLQTQFFWSQTIAGHNINQRSEASFQLLYPY